MKKLLNFELKKVYGGLSRKDFECKPEEALSCFGAKGIITWGNNLSVRIPRPSSKNETLFWNREVWTPVPAHCGWHQCEIIWKDSKGNYLVPTGIEMNGM